MKIEKEEPPKNTILTITNSSNPENIISEIVYPTDKTSFLLRIYKSKIIIFNINNQEFEFLKNIPFTESISTATLLNHSPNPLLFLQFQFNNCSVVSLCPDSLTFSTLWLSNNQHLSRGRGLTHEMVSLFRRPYKLGCTKLTRCQFNQLVLIQNDNSVFNIYLFEQGREVLSESEVVRNSMLGLFRKENLPWTKIQKRFQEEQCVWLENNIRNLRKDKKDFSVSFDLGFDGLGRIIKTRLTWSGFEGREWSGKKGFYQSVSEGTGIDFHQKGLSSQWKGQLPYLYLLVQQPQVGFFRGFPKLNQFKRNLFRIPLNLQIVAEGPKLAQKLDVFDIGKHLGATTSIFQRVKDQVKDFWVVGVGCILCALDSSDLFIVTAEEYFFILLDVSDKEYFESRFGASKNRIFSLREFFPEDIHRKEVSCLSKTNKIWRQWMKRENQ
jgi:hypothetical protein